MSPLFITTRSLTESGRYGCSKTSRSRWIICSTLIVLFAIGLLLVVFVRQPLL